MADGGGLQAMLLKAKLKATQGPREVVRDVQLCNSSEEYKNMMQETFMEQYLEIIKDCSFKSALLPLSVRSAQALVKAREIWLLRAAERKETEVPSIDLIEADPVLQELAASIEAVKQKHGQIHLCASFFPLTKRRCLEQPPLYESLRGGA